MDLIQLKIGKDSSITKYIKIIRKFDDSLSVGTIKQRIDENYQNTECEKEVDLSWMGIY